MAIPPEFNFTDENDFVLRFLIPLLQRLGFFLVCNHHGHAEFGKDLIFAEIDRFSHVRYHGLQAKYKTSISVNEIQSLIDDCTQAFANPFTHPQTGMHERICSFYAVNAGSIGPEAIQHYFNSLKDAHSGNVRLLQGKDLLELDRWASLNQTQDMLAVINGLGIELKLNRAVVSEWVPVLKSKISGIAVAWPLTRLKIDAVSAYIMRPIFQNIFHASEILSCWQLSDVCNRIFDRLTGGSRHPSNVDAVMNACLGHLSALDKLSTSVQTALAQALQHIGPLAAV